jgi:hypothetical protein
MRPVRVLGYLVIERCFNPYPKAYPTDPFCLLILSVNSVLTLIRPYLILGTKEGRVETSDGSRSLGEGEIPSVYRCVERYG